MLLLGLLLLVNVSGLTGSTGDRQSDGGGGGGVQAASATAAGSDDMDGARWGDLFLRQIEICRRKVEWRGPRSC